MIFLRRLLVGVLGLVVVAAAALVVVVAVDRVRTDGRVEALANVRVPGPGGDVHAYRADPPGDGPHPAVVMIHEFYGLREDVTGKADALARDGYVVIAPDTFRGVSVDGVPAAIWNVLSSPDDRVDADLRAVVDALVADPTVDGERIVVMGFCYGGGAALRYSTGDGRLAGTGVFYGTPITDPDRLAALPGPVLGVFGDEDASIPLREVEAFEGALEAAGVPHDVRVYDGVGHAFVGGMDEIRAGGAAGEAWEAFRAWTAEVTATAE